MTAEELDEQADKWADLAFGRGPYAVSSIDVACFMVAASIAWTRAAQLRGMTTTDNSEALDQFVDVALAADEAAADSAYWAEGEDEDE